MYRSLISLMPKAVDDAQAFIIAAGITDPTQQSAIITLVSDLKAYGIWTKFSAIYPFVGGTAFAHKFNLKNPLDTNAAFRLVFNGGWTHSSTGALPNGINGWAETYLNNSLVLSQNSTHLSLYSRTNNSNAIVDISNSSSTYNGSPSLFINFNGSTYIQVNQNSYSSVGDGNSLGLRIASRINLTTEKLYKNNSLLLTSLKPSLGLSNGTMNLSKWFSAGYWSNREYAFCTIGDGLSDSEASNLYTAVQAFQTTLGRQV